ncbi:MAG: T9SS type A sorting domain-containing protein [Flavobacteriales bacterium]|nr:T9SS type A sorting domain-containing protein [Flavobacteriales bacterium]
MENVPLGLTYEASSPTLTYFPQVDPFGCVRICGIPMIAGSDTIRLTATAQGTVGGVAVNQDYSLNIPIEIWPASQDTIPDFSFSPDSLCAPMTVSFSNPADAPGMTSAFNWNFGNGNTHSGNSPPTQTYNSGGEYPVTLQSTFSVPMLTQVAITSVSGAWCGDLDEPNLPIIGCVGQPDLYFSVMDSRLAMVRSAVVNNVQSTTWNNLAIPLAFPPFTLRVYDSDALSADDILGTFAFDASSGISSFSASGTAGQHTVQVQTVLSLTYTDTVVVFPLPDLTLSFNAVSGLLCASEAELASYSWTLDGNPVIGESGSCVVATNGLWAVTGVNGFGCSSSASLVVTGVGLDELESDGELIGVYPVPTREQLFVRLFDSILTGWQLTITDPSGRLLLYKQIPGSPGPVVVDVSSLAPGTYVLRVHDADRAAVKRFVVAP